ncbi:HEPN domain-containing protein [Pseudomonas lijiangensis]|uniref:Apea-like HEPN domain-containing protein n=1 Tax=Pseudomonas lijiangensis TaxID=2995658 RepID=A0ABX8HQJ3_9PSED|nr:MULTISPECIES: HEPN domain-containing protein [Pseudomonas syringae group]MBX8499814.1 hypothetical protein [Pseudomonas lijiangensis]MBX8503933.1 hypothetical protein [Pseudomonas lijiangensis]MBX8566003.1 hypothetical protein [Pseudomonas cichorii]QWU81686.1 hypothetical protein KQP88_16675 [Pseudomonas lijiangensis]
MSKEKRIDVMAVKKRLEVLIPQYINSLSNKGSEDYEGSFYIFEFDEQLLKALTKTAYAEKYLDYDFFMGLLHSIVVNYGVIEPELIAKRINEYVESTSDSRDWVAIFPFIFNQALSGFLRGKSTNNDLRYGVFAIKTAPHTYEQLSEVLGREFDIEGLSKVDHKHQTFQGSGSIAKCPLIMFDVHGAQDAAFNYGKWKVRYLISLLEVYGVLAGCKGISWAGNEIETNHVFLVNKTTGAIERSPIRMPTRINVDPSYKFYESLDGEFSIFSNMVINHNDKLFVRLKSALNFFSRGLNGADRVLGFVSYVIAIEAIFSRDKHTPIRITLAEYIALLCYPSEERVKVYGDVKSIYDARSALVHTGKIEIDDDLIRKAEAISAKTILYTFRLYDKLNSSGNGKIEERFFNHLRDLRLGVVGED